ncbi:alpha/beta hydrolase [Tumidithrix elongata RA019]|uniref:Alpha/beta hydrolase n=1 Tax=Tumidithrix elongata BACA0141 TaxID=2716417 RepID=A0AAW9PSY4_9CYAN|nr:alpha/beta hydrolase [Tumidithrix elongata RA019]
MQTLKSQLLKAIASLAVIVGISFFTEAKTFASDEIKFRYSIFEASVTVSQLEEFTKTGELDSPLGEFLNQKAPLNCIVQHALKQQVMISRKFLDKALNHTVGEFFLDQAGQVIQMPAGGANRQALRAALLLSAQDNQVSIIEIIKNYPAQHIIVDGEKLEKFQEDFAHFAKILQNLFPKE